MTIAAGFLYSDGVMLCADTELTQWAATLHASKITLFSCPGGNVAMAYAGNANLATTAIQKCARRLQEVSAKEALPEIERLLDKQYRKAVLSHPNHASDSNLAYSMLISLCSPDGELSLYATDQTTVRLIETYECIGIGESLAHYLVRASFRSDMGERQALNLAAFMLACVKDSVPNCGGLSQFVVLRKDRTVQNIFAGSNVSLNANTEWIDRHSKGFDEFARRVLLSIANPEITEIQFEAKLDAFKAEILRLRKDWREKAFVHESMADLLRGKPKTKNIEDSIRPPSTTGDPSPPRPSPELHERTDES